MKTGSYKERFLTVALWVTGLFAAVSLHAQAMEPAVDSLRADTSEVSDPDWYVAPDVREDYLRTPKRASANVCPLDSVCIFNIDSILVEVTVYEYGDTTRTVVWTVNPDGSRVGKSRTESASTATTSYSAAFTWDAATNDWKGTAKEEHTYNSANKEILRLLYNTWLNNEWVANTKYTWVYDEAGRESEYTTYTRNTTTNELVLSQQRIREYNAAGKITLEIQYTAHDGTDWSAGTKKEYDYDAAGNQTEYTYYGSLSNSNWIGSTHEVWIYNAANKTTYYEKHTWADNEWANTTKEIWKFNAAGKQTFHEKYNGSNSTWTLALQENSGYDEAGNNTLVENYSLTNNVWKGTKKEEYTYVGTNKTGTITYNWNANSNTFVYKTWSINNTAENPNEKCSYNWVNDTWVGTGTRRLTTKTGGKTTEVITQTWSSGSTVWVNKTCTTTVYFGDNKTQETYYNWSNDVWAGTKRTDYTFNADGINIMTHNAKWQNNAWVMTSMTRTDISDETIDGVHQISYTQWQCGADSVWKGVQKDTTSYYITAENTQNPLYSASFSSMVNNAWVPSYRIEYEYDEADREIRNCRMDWVNNKWKGHYLYEYEYDDRGQQTAYTYYGDWNSSTNSWIGGSKYDYVYAANGKYAQKIMYKWLYEDNQWVGLFQYFYRYDDANNEIEQMVQSYSNGEWQNSQLYIHEYNGTQLIKNNEYRWRNEQWQYMRCNESYYDEDTQAKLRRQITGSWNTSGVAQSYSDKLYSYECDPRTIRFVNYDGTLLETQTLDKGIIPSYSGVAPTREGNAEYSYTFSGWNPDLAPVTSNVTYTATFTATKNTYTITWVDEAGNEIDRTTVEYGVMPTHAEPSKANTAEFSYGFTGWTPGLGIVTGDASYTATFDTTKNSYTITWLNDDLSQIDQTTVEYGVVPTHADPTKQATDAHSYAFAGWTPQVVAVTGNATYTATFTETTKTYTIYWLNEDGSEISHENLAYGATPAHADPSKEATPEYTYTFSGWTPQIATVTGDASYTATFTATKRSYTITWLNEDGSEISHETLEYGATPAHADIDKENTPEYTYTFAGWSPGIGIVTGDATYTATFTATKNSYTINWLNSDNSPLAQTTVAYGETPTAPADPTKESTAQYTYTFAGWTPEVETVTEAATYTATYDSVVNEYTISWFNDDNTLIDQTTVAYGVVPTHADATKENTAEFTYTFSGWDHEPVAVVGNASYTATYTATKNSYTVTWLNEDGSLIASETLEYGATPAHTNIYKENTAEWTYTFAGWTPGIGIVTGDATYTATFTATKNKYLITFKDEDGTILKSEELEYGAMPTIPTTPTKPADGANTYTFAGWDKEIAPVTEVTTYTATYNATKNIYTVTWLNSDNSPLAQTTVVYGESPVYTGEKPSRPNTAEYTYTFAGWDKEIVPVEDDATYTATYDSVRNSYTVTFYYEDGVTVLDQVTVQYGETPSTSLIPSKYSEEHYYYTFSSWSPEVVPAEGNASYTATFTAVPKQYTVTFKNHNGRTLLTTETPYGEIPEYTGETPTRTKDKQYTYTFSGWSPELTEVTGPTTYTAVFEGTLNQYTVIFLDEDGTELDRQTLDYGTVPVYGGETPQKEEDEQYRYTFKDWSPKLTSVTKNATYRATYSRYDKTQGIEDVQPPCMEAQKILIGNTIYIFRGGKTYTLQGIPVE